MTPDQIAAMVRESKARWTELCARWSELGLPGSQYMPHEFLIKLLLGQFRGTPDEIAAAVREGDARLRALQEAKVIGQFGSDAEKMAVCALALLNGSSEAAPAIATPSQSVPPPAMPLPEPTVIREVVVAPCPHCAHDPERCAEGGYVLLPPSVSPAPGPTASVAVESSPLQPLASPIVTFQTSVVNSCPGCGHRVDCCKDGHYGDTPLAHAAVHEIAVRGCEHVGADGKCTLCTADATEECSGQDCDHQVIVAKAKKCKAYGEDTDDCDGVFCEDCECLNDYGYCSDCETITCDGCQTDFDHGTEQICANAECAEFEDFCDECAPRRLNAQGLCRICAKEDHFDCDGCNEVFVESRVTQCVNEQCERGYCSECKEANLDEQGRCDDCPAAEA